MTFSPGDRCGGHLIVALLEVTEGAELYEARDGRDGGRRVLKVVVQSRKQTRLEARLGVEAQAIATIDHAHVARFHDAGVHEGKVWLLREHVEGVTLRAKMAATPPVEDVLRWIRQACERPQVTARNSTTNWNTHPTIQRRQARCSLHWRELPPRLAAGTDCGPLTAIVRCS